MALAGRCWCSAACGLVTVLRVVAATVWLVGRSPQQHFA
ncbi:putative membrane protein [Mycobacterium kansasii 824]|nr:putative membrane protein [Mycobacterium kansasii 824]